VNADRLFQFAEKIVNKDGQTGNMIHMRVRDDYVADLTALGFVKRNADTAGINRDAIVNEEAGQALRRVSASTVIERAG
jgi:hypothetical protein